MQARVQAPPKKSSISVFTQPRPTRDIQAMDTRTLLLHLEQPLQCYTGIVPVGHVVMAGLDYETSDYWPGLAVGWLEQGAPVDSNVLQALARVSLFSAHPTPKRCRYKAACKVAAWATVGAESGQSPHRNAVTHREAISPAAIEFEPRYFYFMPA